MNFSSRKTYITGGIILILLVVILIVLSQSKKEEIIIVPEEPVEEEVVSTSKVIGSSVEGRPIEVYTYGIGDKHILFVGGIHGGYEWNSVYLAYRFIDYVEANLDIIPKTVTVSVIPSLNPDGLFKIVGSGGRFTVEDVPDTDHSSGRFNANAVDLNRNFDCKWQPESTWRSQPVSAGTAPFSEPESKAIRDFILKESPDAVVFWHSQSNAVYASECEAGVLPETLAIMNAYSQASGYPAVASFDAYPITGDVEGWLASLGIPALTVELSNHNTIEWDKNIAGVNALLNYYK